MKYIYCIKPLYRQHPQQDESAATYPLHSTVSQVTTASSTDLLAEAERDSMTTATAGRSVFTKLKSIPIQYPLLFGGGLSCVKTSGSDLLVQKVVEQRDDIDWKRNVAFASFGLFYLGGVQYALYVNIFQRLFPRAASFAAKPLVEKFKDIKGLGALGGQVRHEQ